MATGRFFHSQEQLISIRHAQIMRYDLKSKRSCKGSVKDTKQRERRTKFKTIDHIPDSGIFLPDFQTMQRDLKRNGKSKLCEFTLLINF